MIGYFPDRDLLDSQAPRPGADVAQEAPRGFLIIVMTQSFLASLEGLLTESIVVLMFNENYGWMPDDVLGTFTAFAVGSVVFGLFNREVLVKRITHARLALGSFVLPIVLAPVCIHFEDMMTARRPSVAIPGLVAMLLPRIVTTVLQQRAPEAAGTPAGGALPIALSQAVAQIGRLVAPILGVALYDAGKEMGGAGMGLNTIFSFQFTLFLMIQLLLATHGETVYGSWSDLPAGAAKVETPTEAASRPSKRELV